MESYQLPGMHSLKWKYNKLFLDLLLLRCAGSCQRHKLATQVQGLGCSEGISVPISGVRESIYSTLTQTLYFIGVNMYWWQHSESYVACVQAPNVGMKQSQSVGYVLSMMR